MNPKNNGEQKQKGDFFYFDVDDKSHEKILEKELKEAKEDPLAPLGEVLEVEY